MEINGSLSCPSLVAKDGNHFLIYLLAIYTFKKCLCIGPFTKCIIWFLVLISYLTASTSKVHDSHHSATLHRYYLKSYTISSLWQMMSEPSSCWQGSNPYFFHWELWEFISLFERYLILHPYLRLIWMDEMWS